MFEKNSYNKLYENPTNDLVTDARYSQMDEPFISRSSMAIKYLYCNECKNCSQMVLYMLLC
jgi:hypothetical protein